MGMSSPGNLQAGQQLQSVSVAAAAAPVSSIKLPQPLPDHLRRCTCGRPWLLLTCKREADQAAPSPPYPPKHTKHA
jgi:hypothetical protein